jgi:iron complex outermembrane receptor protein
VPVNYPVGTIVSNNWFLPQLGAIWDLTSHAHVFFNYQKNLRFGEPIRLHRAWPS